jgi:hypothetical protein
VFIHNIILSAFINFSSQLPQVFLLYFKEEYIMSVNYSLNTGQGVALFLASNNTIGFFSSNTSERLDFTQGNAKFASNVYVLNNVGIGTSNPDYKLDVQGSTRVGGDLSISGNIMTNKPLYINGLYIQKDSNSSGTVTSLSSAVQNLSVTSTGTEFRIPTSNEYFNFSWCNTNPLVTILGAGRMGIMSSNPIHTLEVRGSLWAQSYCNLLVDTFMSSSTSNAPTAAAVSNLYTLAIGASNQASLQASQWVTSNAGVYIGSSSNIAVGTSLVDTDVSVTLQQFNTANTGVRMYNLTRSLRSDLSMVGVDGSYFLFAKSGDSILRSAIGRNILIGSESRWSASNFGICINSNGCLGVGSVNPQYPLDIIGDLNFTGNLRRGGNLYVSSQFTTSNNNVFILSSNIGIGTSNPEYILDVGGDLNFTGALRKGGIEYPSSQFSSSSSNVFIIGSNLGVGRSNPQYRLDVLGDINFSGNLLQNGSVFVSGSGGGGGSGSNQWASSSSNVFIIGSNVGIGLSNPLYALQVQGDIYASQDVIVNSDSNIKDNLEVISSALSKMNTINGYTFTRKDLDSNKRYTGVLAQDIQRILPEAVYKDEDTGRLSVAYGNLAGLFVQGFKELMGHIEDIKERLSVLESSRL